MKRFKTEKDFNTRLEYLEYLLYLSSNGLPVIDIDMAIINELSRLENKEKATALLSQIYKKYYQF